MRIRQKTRYMLARNQCMVGSMKRKVFRQSGARALAAAI